MSNNASVIVFPSIFAQNKVNLLISNIKKMLKIRNQQFSKIKKDDSVVVIEAHDPVFASSAINLLFGIKRVAIAKQVKNEFDVVVSQISKIGSNLLLKGDVFYVKVEGFASGYLPKDVEIAATSSLIEKTNKLGAKPGTEEKHDKLLYTYLTKSNAYVCIFTDEGHGGIPYNSHQEKIVCGIYDELSAVSCIETIKEGYDVKIIVCYRKKSDLAYLAKILNRILPRMVQQKIELNFVYVPIRGSSPQSYLQLVNCVTEILISFAHLMKIKKISLALSPLIFTTSVLDNNMRKVFENKLIPNISLAGLESDIMKTANDTGLSKYLKGIEKIAKMKFNGLSYTKKESSIVKKALKKRKSVLLTIGPNNIHDILDSLT